MEGKRLRESEVKKEIEETQTQQTSARRNSQQTVKQEESIGSSMIYVAHGFYVGPNSRNQPRQNSVRLLSPILSRGRFIAAA